MVKTTLKIDGMMCGMCEAHINDTIRKIIPDAKKVTSSHTNGESSFVTENPVNEQELAAAIAETGYELKSMETADYKKKFLGIF